MLKIKPIIRKSRESSDLNVFSLHIAKVKQKCGIIELENYNKWQKRKQTQCPTKKENIIIDVLKHFGMI